MKYYKEIKCIVHGERYNIHGAGCRSIFLKDFTYITILHIYVKMDHKLSQAVISDCLM
jgi:hypothetical protein